MQCMMLHYQSINQNIQHRCLINITFSLVLLKYTRPENKIVLEVFEEYTPKSGLIDVLKNDWRDVQVSGGRQQKGEDMTLFIK